LLDVPNGKGKAPSVHSIKKRKNVLPIAKRSRNWTGKWRGRCGYHKVRKELKRLKRRGGGKLVGYASIRGRGESNN